MILLHLGYVIDEGDVVPLCDVVTSVAPPLNISKRVQKDGTSCIQQLCQQVLNCKAGLGGLKLTTNLSTAKGSQCM